MDRGQVGGDHRTSAVTKQGGFGNHPNDDGFEEAYGKFCFAIDLNLLFWLKAVQRTTITETRRVARSAKARLEWAVWTMETSRPMQMAA